MARWLLSVLLMTVACIVSAQVVTPDKELERRAMALSEQLRCLVCQNQSLADSHAGLAVDLKNQVREKLAQGMSDKDVVDYMVTRYGDFVLYRPPVKPSTWLLWFGPFLLLVTAIAVLLMKLLRRPEERESVTETEMQRAAELLNEKQRRGESA